MAEVLGVDMTAALAHGALDGEDWRDAVLRCTCCDGPDACLAWLANFDGAVPALAAPGNCRNAALFDHLRREAVSEVRA